MRFTSTLCLLRDFGDLLLSDPKCREVTLMKRYFIQGKISTKFLKIRLKPYCLCGIRHHILHIDIYCLLRAIVKIPEGQYPRVTRVKNNGTTHVFLRYHLLFGPLVIIGSVLTLLPFQLPLTVTTDHARVLHSDPTSGQIGRDEDISRPDDTLA